MNQDKINTSIAKLLKNREIGMGSVYRSAGRVHRPLEIQNLPQSINVRIDSDCCGAVKHIRRLKLALERKSWLEIEATVGDIITTLFDNSQNRSANDIFSVTPKKRLEREFFVLYGGVRLLFQLFASPFGEPNSRSTALYSGKHEVWNEVIVILREVAIAIPTISEKIFENSDIVFLFSFLHHQAMFDNTMNLLEEILASRDETFSLLLIPNFFSLVDSFSSRQLAHFCRVLSLVLFEPEDRQIMEGSHVLKSVDLLQLRRNRMAKNSSYIVERNQSLVIEMPQLLGRLIQILKVLNYGPNLSDLISHNIVTPSPITSDILNFSRSHLGSTDWDHLSDLERQVASSKSINSSPSGRKEDRSTRVTLNRATPNQTIASSSPPPAEGHVAPPRHSSTVRVPLEFSTPLRHGGSDYRNTSQVDEEDDIMAELLSAFSPDQSGGDSDRFFELSVSNIVSVIQVARSLGIADLTPLGESLVVTQPGMSERLRSQNGSLRGSRTRTKTPAHCKKELQFHAMMLSPYQIELIFVLCTLLSGRRKVSIQKKFADLGLAKVLREMYDRMSWDSPPYAGESLEHIHGPGCECNPESALRVQFLRLIHNFFDRDFLGNENKLLILSAQEQEVVNYSVDGEQIKNGIAKLLTEDRGTLSEIIRTLISEPSDSVYCFWLSACVENFLRGCGQAGQLFVAHSGMLQHITQHVIRTAPSTNNSRQTAFDLLGELVKCNQTVLELLENSFDDSEFRLFVRIVMDNLVDSNVFIRSLVLSLEMLSYDDSMDQGMTEFGFFFNSLVLGSDPNTAKASTNISGKTSGSEAHLSKLGFLTDTWVQFLPSIQSNRAIDLYKNNSKGGGAHNSKKSQTFGPKRSAASPHITNKKVGLSSESKNIFDTDNIPYRCNLDIYEDGNSFQKIPHSPQQQIQSPLSSAKSDGGPLARPSAQSLPDTSISSTKPTKSSGAFYSGMYETLKDLRKATDSFLKFGTKSPTNATTSSSSSSSSGSSGSSNKSTSIDDRQFSSNPIKIQKFSASSGNSSSNIDKSNDDDVDEFDLFKTPPEPPRFATSKSSPSRKNMMTTDSRSADLSAPVPPSSLTTEKLSNVPLLENDTSYDGGDSLKDSPRYFDANNAEINAITNAKVFIPSSLFRISVFLVQEKVGILVRMISTVTLRTINHENICCLNTALLILLFEHRRGQLAWTLNKVRDLANAEYEGCADDGNNEILCGSCGDREQYFSSKSSKQSLQPECDICHSDQSVCDCETESKSATETEPSGADKIMQNFRGLLWYWREYYLRRGRDRLSIEFSNHIPFRYWMELVDLLCLDNGSPMSLLDKPMYLPPSPYNRPFIGSYFTQAIDNNIILL